MFNKKKREKRNDREEWSIRGLDIFEWGVGGGFGLEMVIKLEGKGLELGL